MESNNRSEISFSFTILPRSILMKRKLYFHRLREEYTVLIGHTHTHTLPEIQVYKQLIIKKIKNFIMYPAIFTYVTPSPSHILIKIQNLTANVSQSWIRTHNLYLVQQSPKLSLLAFLQDKTPASLLSPTSLCPEITW